MWNLHLLQLLDEARYVARIGDEHVLRALLHAHQRVHRQREDVVERQRADIDQARRLRLDRVGVLDPQRHLRDIGEHVAVEQRRALGHARRAAGILQERHVVRRDLDRLELAGGALPDRGVEGDMARQRPCRHHLLDAAHDEIDQQPLDAEHVAHGRHDDVLDRDLADHRLQRVGEILQDDDGLGAGILELVLELARRVERVDVHHGAAGAQYAHDRDRILQHVGHHDGDARALGEALRLEKGAEGRRLALELAEADGLAHAGEGGTAGILLAGADQEVADRACRQRRELGGDFLRIALQPGFCRGGGRGGFGAWRAWARLALRSRPSAWPCGLCRFRGGRLCLRGRLGGGFRQLFLPLAVPYLWRPRRHKQVSPLQPAGDRLKIPDWIASAGSRLRSSG